jgi:hypothetical protein
VTGRIVGCLVLLDHGLEPVRFRLDLPVQGREVEILLTPGAIPGFLLCMAGQAVIG